MRNSDKVLEEFMVIYNECDIHDQCVPKVMPETMYNIKTEIVSQIAEPYKMETLSITIESDKQFIIIKKNAFKVYGRTFKTDDTYFVAKAV